MKKLLIIFVLSVLVFACKMPKCVRSHQEMRHSPAWTQFICTSYDKNGMCTLNMPIYHPAYDYETTVCDEYEKTK